MDTNCVRCGRKVKPEENWLKAHLWASTAIFHWNCFIALMKSHGEAGAEQMTWRAMATRRCRWQKSATVNANRPSK
jgi:hypothetical protein